MNEGKFEEALEELDTYEKQRAEWEAKGYDIGGTVYRQTYRAEALQGLGRHEEALKVGDEIVEGSPEWDDAYVYRAQIRHRAGKFDEAVEDFSKAFNSFGVTSQVRQAESRARSARITGTPEMVVAGKYRISTRKAGSQAAMLKIAEFLIEKERAAAAGS